MRCFTDLILSGLAITFLLGCEQEQKPNPQLSEIEKRVRSMEEHNNEISNRISDLNGKLATIIQTLHTNADDVAKNEKIGAARLEINQSMSKQLKDIDEALKAFSKSTTSNQQAVDKTITYLTTLFRKTPEAPHIRWAFVDKYKVQREVNPLLQPPPLPDKDDPNKQPELAKKLAEYQVLQTKSMQRNMPPGMHFVTDINNGVNPPEKESTEAVIAGEKRLAELKIDLAPYLSREQQGNRHVEEEVNAAMRDYGKGKFDLILDKNFGEHQIYYKADAFVPDVTDDLIDFIKNRRAVR